MATVAAPGPAPVGGQNYGDTLRPHVPFSILVAGAVFLTLWYTVLFAVLSFGVRSQHETGDIAARTGPGAPVARLPIVLGDFRMY
jgi:Protein of unknown function (DUF1467)